MSDLFKNSPSTYDYLVGLGYQFKEKVHKGWLTTRCDFHGGSDSMRVHKESGGWKCMNCEVRGGGSIKFEMERTGASYETACRRLGCWSDSNRSRQFKTQLKLSDRDALNILQFDAGIVLLIASDMSKGIAPSKDDMEALVKAIGRMGLTFKGQFYESI